MSAAPSTAASAAAESNPRNGLLRKQIFALTKKNYLLSRRSKLTVCCEILLPLFVAVVCFVVAPLVNSSSRDLVTYAEAEYPYTISEGARPGTLFYASRIRDTYERYTELSALTSYQNFVNNSNPITLLLTCACQTLAIGPAGTPAAEDFASYLRSSFDSVFKGLNLPQCGGGPSITISTSVSDPRDYVASSEYGSAAFPELCGYMSVENPYEVLVMGNATVGDNGRFKAVSFDYSEYNSFWYAENGDIQHGDPDDNGLIYYEALNMPALLGTYLDYRRGDSRPIAGVYPMPYESYQTRGAGSDLILLGNVLGPFLYTFSAFSVSRKLISERKGRLREGMRIMGLFDFPYNVSWYLWYVSFYLVFSFIVAVLSLVVLPIVSALWLFLLSLLYFFASMSFAFAISTLFENPNSGSTLTAVIYYVLAITVSVIERETSKWAISLLPQCAFTLIIQNLGQQLFLGKESPSATLAFQDFTLLQGLLMLIVDFVLWTVVYLYLDQVVPHEYRSSRKFYFLFTKGFWREMTGKDEVDEARGQGTEAVPSEVSSSTVDEGIERVRGEQQGKLERDGQVVRIHDLKVEFGQFRAVDGLDLTMYRDELFVLLGHNGAGKSTTINVLSGMIKPTSGAVTIFNREVPTEMPVIRRSMGICPQNDVLWDDLTVSEHFDIFA
ncbi:(ABC) transporter, partial [Perkinsus chesapeaki]